MLHSKLKIRQSYFLFFITIFAFNVYVAPAQSTSQSYPTPIVTNEISGAIKPRDVGDSRLTNYFYTFNSVQGDVFINVVTSNFNGDIDVFNADGLKHLTKIVVYSDAAVNETGRVIYFRKPEKLILRVEGRTPNDEAGTFKIKFAGSFVAAANVKTEEPSLPEVASSNQTDVRVNSVGTIIEIKPKATPTPAETVAKNDASKDSIKEISIETSTDKSVIAEAEISDKNDGKIEVKQSEKKLEVVVSDNIQSERSAPNNSERKTENSKTPVANNAENSTVAKVAVNETVIAETEENASTAPKPKVTTARNRSRRTRAPKTPTTPKTPAKIEPNPLENIRLIVLFKDGAKIERPMSDVLKVGVDKGILTIISKNGAIGRYSILEVTKMTIE